MLEHVKSSDRRSWATKWLLVVKWGQTMHNESAVRGKWYLCYIEKVLLCSLKFRR